MTKLHFNYKDIFRAFRLGFSAKKIWVGFLGLLFGWIGYTVLSYVAYIVSGTDIVVIWDSFRLLPVPGAFHWVGWILWSVGLAWFVVVSMVTGIAISKLTYEQLKGDEFFEVREAWKQAFKSAGALVATPFLLALTIVLLLAGGILLGLFGLIPYAGEIIIGVFAIPAFAVSLCIIYLGIVLLFSFSIGPAVIGTTKSDAFDNLFEVFSCVNDQPWRLIWYQLMLIVFSLAGMVILAFFSGLALRVGTSIVGLITGEKLYSLVNSTVGFSLPDWLWWLQDFIERLFSMSALTASGAAQASGWSMLVGKVLFSIAYHFIILFVLGYGMAIWYSGNTVIYLILVRKKDERNLLEIKDEEIEIPEKLDVSVPPEPAAPAGPKKLARAAVKKPVKKPAKKAPAKKTRRP